MIKVPNNIRQLCEKDSCRKNIRIHFVNNENDDLTNNDILTESVSLTEAICSGELRFGLCESSIFTAECKLDRNLKGAEILVTLEIDISNESETFIFENGHVKDDVDFPFYEIPYGRFVIKSCKKSKNGLRQIEAYTQTLGDDKVTSDGTVSFLDYGLQDSERVKMEYAVKSNVAYKMNIPAFVYSNVGQIEKPSEFDGEVEITGTTTPAPFRGSAVVLYEDGTWSRMWGGSSDASCEIDYYQFDTLDEALYYVEFATHETRESLNKKLCDFYSERLGKKCVDFRFNTWTYVDSSPIDPTTPYISVMQEGSILAPGTTYRTTGNISESGSCFSPFLSRASSESIKYTVYFMKNFTVNLNRDSLTIDLVHDFSIKKVSGVFNNLSLTFPRTNNNVYVSNKYQLNYRDLLTNGMTVTKKDKSGNTVTQQYQLSFRELIEGFAELNATFGMYWRHAGAFAFKGLNFPTSVYPGEGITPGSTTKPDGAVYLIDKSAIEDITFDDELTKPYYRILATCSPSNATEESEIEYKVNSELLIDAKHSLDYDITSNYCLKTIPMTTTQIRNYMVVLADALQKIRYMPCEIVLRGIPFVEAGDWVEFETNDGTMITNVLRQTIRGVQSLRTNIESEG